MSLPVNQTPAEAKAAEVLRSWLSDEQARQLDEHGAFKVYARGISPYAPDRVYALVHASYMVYDPPGRISYGWFPAEPLPPSDALLCQALALSDPRGRGEMLYRACQWPRGCNPSPNTADYGPAWAAVDRLMGDQPALW